AGEVGFITNLGNPALWWLAIPALLFCVWAMTRGPLGTRLGMLALLAVALAVLVLVFHSLEQPFQLDSNRSTYIVPVATGPLLLVAYGVVAVAAVAVVACAVLARRFVPAVIVLAYLSAWLMWAPGNQERVLFLYHMLGALPYMALALAYGLTALRGTVL